VQVRWKLFSDLLAKLSNDQVKIKVLHASVGAITETDVLLASASNAIIIGFNVRPERKAQEMAAQEKVDIRLHSIIYELQDEMKKAMVGLLEPTIKETYLGRAEVRDTFRIRRSAPLPVAFIADGTIKRDSEVRLLRDNVVVFKERSLRYAASRKMSPRCAMDWSAVSRSPITMTSRSATLSRPTSPNASRRR